MVDVYVGTRSDGAPLRAFLGAESHEDVRLTHHLGTDRCYVKGLDSTMPNGSHVLEPSRNGHGHLDVPCARPVRPAPRARAEAGARE